MLQTSIRPRRFAGVNMTQGSFTLTAGRSSSAPAFAPMKIDPLRGAQIIPFGKGADNSTFDYRIWLVGRGERPNSNSNPDSLGSYELFLYGHGTVTLSTATGDGSEPATPGANDLTDVYTTERFGDTMTWVLDTFGTAMEAAYGSGAAGVSSPADNTPACLFIPDIFDKWGLVFEVDLTGATAANAMIQPIR